MAEITYPFAFDENKNLIEICSVYSEHRYEHFFSCPGCGNEMRPRLGKKNAHCFYHFNCEPCDSESYIHRVGKELLYKRFNNPELPFLIEFEQKVRCEELYTCQVCNKHSSVCIAIRPSQIDLKDFYDTAAIEKDFYKKNVGTFRADVLLSSSNANREPFFIEVCYKHPCSDEKINSGIRILELKVNDLHDLSRILSAECFSSIKPLRDKYFEVNLYNLKEKIVSREDILKDLSKKQLLFPCSVVQQEISFTESRHKGAHSYLFSYVEQEVQKYFIREVFYNDVSYIYHLISCNEPHFDTALFDITFVSWICEEGHCHSPREFFSFYNPEKSKFLECSFCFYKNLVKECKFNSHVEKAQTCPHYLYKSKFNFDALVEGKDYFVWVNPRFNVSFRLKDKIYSASLSR